VLLVNETISNMEFDGVEVAAVVTLERRIGGYAVTAKNE